MFENPFPSEWEDATLKHSIWCAKRLGKRLEIDGVLEAGGVCAPRRSVGIECSQAILFRAGPGRCGTISGPDRYQIKREKWSKSFRLSVRLGADNFVRSESNGRSRSDRTPPPDGAVG